MRGRDKGRPSALREEYPLVAIVGLSRGANGSSEDPARRQVGLKLSGFKSQDACRMRPGRSCMVDPCRRGTLFWRLRLFLMMQSPTCFLSIPPLVEVLGERVVEVRRCEAGQGEPSVSTRLGQDDMDDMRLLSRAPFSEVRYIQLGFLVSARMIGAMVACRTAERELGNFISNRRPAGAR